MSFVLRIGSRKSSLAKLQSCFVRDALLKEHPNLNVELFFKEASGDQDLVTPLWKMPTRGVFTQDLTKELTDGNVDLVIHSYKDLDLEGHAGTETVMVLPRADQRDVLLWKRSAFDNPPNEIKIHSSSPRREYNLSAFLPSALPRRYQGKPIYFHPVRGNVQTRVRKWLEDDSISGLVVAKAALDRLLSREFSFAEQAEYSEVRDQLRAVLNEQLFMVLPLSKNPNAPAQGALAAEFRAGDDRVRELLSPLRSLSEERNVGDERRLLSLFGGGCHQKIGVAVHSGESGTILFMRGKTDSGEELDSAIRWRSDEFPRPISDSYIFPTKRQTVGRARLPLPSSPPTSRFWFVARADAFPESWSNPGPDTILVVAGTKTWEKLASRDVWVHASTDGLGEGDAKNLATLLGEIPDFVKLTHEESGIVEGTWDRLSTYKVEWEAELQDLSGYSHFFWMSATQFDRAYRKDPSIAQKIHATGSGATYSYIRNILGTNGKVYAFPNYESWVNACKGEIPDFLKKEIGHL
ncbi:hydroxymethylbilane synthase [Leptospira fainei serovar Hurstbridge str. BUT 6]|uniref:hydroxymethylbilane synthase n=1 Tax=Leptospira fainei serovar Hurstbridge str. BUT 6 TaxID=1193011 RepID=S3UWQ2_9LEPT|nr:hydroxymethylbilane synthase [Leptospira fainei]EPG72789.1 hydroxymethylbilane synthase [Leptospira fainei serovar Hurstbridge str. BUT 6]